MTSPYANALVAVGHYLRDQGYRFITVTPSTHRRINRRPGNERATDLRGIFGWSRPFAPDDVAPELLALMREAGIVEPDGSLLRSTLRASTLGELLVFHSAYPTEDDDAVFFGPDTYRFVGTMGRAFPWLGSGPTRALDIGCGAGAGALAIARQFPHAEVTGADINTRALALTVVNTRLAGLDNLHACHSNLFDSLEGDFDLIVSNPPYIRSADIASLAPEVRDHDPHLALDGGLDGLEAYRRIAPQAAGLLSPRGLLVLEIGQGQVDDVVKLVAAAGLTVAEPIRADLAGIGRAVAARKLPF
jgi:methylase of polypeptide subunit release factors